MPTIFGFLLLNTGYYLLQTDGSSKLILNESVVAPVDKGYVSVKEVESN
jgi:hypothetical protein